MSIFPYNRIRYISPHNEHNPRRTQVSTTTQLLLPILNFLLRHVNAYFFCFNYAMFREFITFFFITFFLPNVNRITLYAAMILASFPIFPGARRHTSNLLKFVITLRLFACPSLNPLARGSFTASCLPEIPITLSEKYSKTN